MYKIKQLPEDFIVEEINNELDIQESGNYTLYRLWKKNYNTANAIKIISEKFNVKPKFINYAGTKDKVAITTQYLTISKGPNKNIELNELKLEFLGYVNERLNLGMLDSNRFTIVVRNIDKLPRNVESIPNYFDSQRFGMNKDNHIIGKLLIEDEFSKAVEKLAENNPSIKEHLSNPVGYFQKIPKNIAKMYVHAYQSYLFNKMLSKILKERSKTVDVIEEFNTLSFSTEEIKLHMKLPLIGFGTELEDDKIEKIVDDLLDEDDITLRDFIIRKIPFLSSEGEEREAFVEIQELEISELEDDELNEGKKKSKVSFILPKGSYATIVIRNLMI